MKYFSKREAKFCMLFLRIPVACHDKVCSGFIFHRWRKSKNLTTSWLIDKHESTYKMTWFWQSIKKYCNLQTFCDSGKERNLTKGRHLRRCFDLLYWIELWKLHRVRGSAIPCYASNQRVYCSVGLHEKRTNKFSNPTCVFIRPTCLTLSLNWRFEATLTHDIH